MKRNAKRERWMQLFEEAVIAMNPGFTGRINWDAATFYFNNGTSPGLAAAKVVASESPIETRH